VHVSRLSLTDFRSWPQVDLDLDPGVTAFVGPNGQGKTNLVEAIGYVSTLSSHRVASDAALVRAGAPRAVVRVRARRGDRESLVELEIAPGRANRAQVNRAPVRRTRDVLGIVRTVVFAPEDLALVKGDPDGRRRFLDALLVQLEAGLLEAMRNLRRQELDRGVNLVGPHRDDLLLGINGLPAKGYASHGESWSLALALRLASYELLTHGDDDLGGWVEGSGPVLVLDDVFAELDTSRRDRLAELVADAEQVLITAAVAHDVPDGLAGARVDVVDGTVRRA